MGWVQWSLKNSTPSWPCRERTCFRGRHKLYLQLHPIWDTIATTSIGINTSCQMHGGSLGWTTPLKEKLDSERHEEGMG